MQPAGVAAAWCGRPDCQSVATQLSCPHKLGPACSDLFQAPSATSLRSPRPNGRQAHCRPQHLCSRGHAGCHQVRGPWPPAPATQGHHRHTALPFRMPWSLSYASLPAQTLCFSPACNWNDLLTADGSYQGHSAMQLSSGCRRCEEILVSAAHTGPATVEDIGQAAGALIKAALGRLMRSE